MYQTQIKPSSQLRNNYAEIIRLVKEERDPVILTNNGKPDAALINLDEYADFEKFMHRQYVREELAAAQREANDPAVKWIPIENVWKRIEDKYGL
jgi:prevent-host-death family protein